MQHADLYTGVAKLRDALELLRVGWGKVEPEWRDEVRREFEEQYLMPIDLKTLGMIEAVGRMAEILGRAENECR